MKIWVPVVTAIVLLIPWSGIVMAGTGDSDSYDRVLDSQGQQGWLPAINLGDSINTSYRDYSPTLTEDENHLILASNRPGTYGGWDLWMADRVSGNVWRSPVNLGSVINSTYDETDPWISPDGVVLVFSSNRPGGYGSYDIWMSKKVGGNWQTPVNMGDVINSSLWDGTPWMSSDTLRLYYNIYQRPGGYGNWDIWQSTKSGGVWGPPVNMGPIINSTIAECNPTLTTEEQTLYLSSNFDIYFSQKISGEWQPKQSAGPNINSSYEEARAWITGNGQKLYFCSGRPGGEGQEDLYVSEWENLGTAHEISVPSSGKSLCIGAPKPNPSTQTMSISFELPASVKVEAGVYNISGQKVKALIRKSLSAGHHELAWEERDQTGCKVPAGIYFIRIQAGEERTTRQIIIFR